MESPSESGIKKAIDHRSPVLILKVDEPGGIRGGAISIGNEKVPQSYCNMGLRKARILLNLTWSYLRIRCRETDLHYLDQALVPRASVLQSTKGAKVKHKYSSSQLAANNHYLKEMLRSRYYSWALMPKEWVGFKQNLPKECPSRCRLTIISSCAQL